MTREDRAALRFVLASASPRRSQLLRELGLRFSVRPADVDEAAHAGESGADLVHRLALAKARARVEAGEIVLAADTVVVIDGAILGKPADAEEAGEMLARIAGREHEVFTGIALATGEARGARLASRIERTAVRMRALSGLEIARYVATGEPLDKAGAYAIQGLGSTLVAAIDGNYTNVVGLPVPAVIDSLRALGFELEEFQ